MRESLLLVPAHSYNALSLDKSIPIMPRQTLDRALGYYHQRPDWWKELSTKNMRIDFSWNSSAETYSQVYTSLKSI